ncbi:MAG: ROK family protein, partial [Clostridia bacterium]|nr:ROK family protein [Clostridia bacterium]
AGLILNGRLFSGSNGNAGEAGHIRLAPRGPVGYGKAGSFEGFCSGGGIAQLAKALAEERLLSGCPVAWGKETEQIDNITTKTVAEYAKQGDVDALSVFNQSAEMLGRGLAVLIDLFNPERIVIGSVYARCEELFKEGMLRALSEEALPASLSVCRVVPAALGEQIGDLAALTVATEGFRGENNG